MSDLFDFSEIRYESNKNININSEQRFTLNKPKNANPEQILTPQNLKNSINKAKKALDDFVKNLNSKINDPRLVFELSEYLSEVNISNKIESLKPFPVSEKENKNNFIETNKPEKDIIIFYLTLKIDEIKVLNILRGKIAVNEQNNVLSFIDIVWMYCLSTEFMNSIFSKGVTYFYNIMKNYYIVVEAQMIIYFNYIKLKIEFIEIISVYNFFVSIDYEYIDEKFMANIDLFKSNSKNILNENNRSKKYKQINFLNFHLSLYV
jgi:hypothetical protein